MSINKNLILFLNRSIITQLKHHNLMSFQTNLHNLNLKSPDLGMYQEKSITKPNKSTNRIAITDRKQFKTSQSMKIKEEKPKKHHRITCNSERHRLNKRDKVEECCYLCCGNGVHAFNCKDKSRDRGNKSINSVKKLPQTSYLYYFSFKIKINLI